MQQPVDFRDEFEQAFRVLPVSRFHAEPHPTLSLVSFHFALRRSLATAQSKLFGAAIVSTFDPRSRTNVVCEICWPSNTSNEICCVFVITPFSQKKAKNGGPPKGGTGVLFTLVPPTTWPTSLMPLAKPEEPPSVPRSLITPFSQR